MKLYELAECYTALKENEELTPEEVVNALKSLNLMIDEKVLSITRWILDIQGDLTVIKSEEDRLATKRKSVQGRIESLKKYVCNCMVEAEKKKINNETISVTVQDNSPSIVIIDETKVPEEMMRIIKEVDKSKILDLWRTTKELTPGTIVETGRKHIVIR